jgi:hypothetical protein
VTAFLENSGETAQKEQAPEHYGRFLLYATFRTVDEVSALLTTAGFSRIFLEHNLHGFCILIAQK